MELLINEKFKDLIPPLTADEFNFLKESIFHSGVREPILIWNNTIIDGHNRYKICKEIGIYFETKKLEFADEDEAVVWIIKNQLGRRNLTDFNKANLALQLENIIKESAKTNQKKAGFITNILKSFQNQDTENSNNAIDTILTASPHKISSPTLCQNSDKASIDTKKEIAKIAGVSHDTIEKVKKINKNAVDEIKQELSKQDGKLSINTAAIISELPGNKQKEILQLDKKDIIKKAQKIKAKEKPANKDLKASFGDVWQADNIEIICCDSGSQAKERIASILNNNGSFVLIADKTKQKSDTLLNLSNIILEKLKKAEKIS